MDSLTQLALGAAAGEAVLGKKIGNRAIMWGAIAGTIPDLDIFARLWMDGLDATAAHRSLTHSLLFCCLAGPPVFAWLTHKLYDKGIHQTKIHKGLLLTVIGLAYLMLFFTAAIRPYLRNGDIPYIPIVIVGVIGALIGWRSFVYAKRDIAPVETNYMNWFWLYFWAFSTHTFIDACTPYGTQLLYPFNNLRVAWNNISVVDPIYTIPLVISLIVAAFYHKKSITRSRIAYTGLILSSMYMAFTFYNQYRVQNIFKQSAIEAGINYKRANVRPVPTQNLLWQGMIESDSTYHYGIYSIFDGEPKIQKFTTVPKNHHLIEPYKEEHDIKLLLWFSKGYYNVEQEGDTLLFHDIRYGLLDDVLNRELAYPMTIRIVNKDGEWKTERFREGPPDEEFPKDIMARLWRRMWGGEFYTEDEKTSLSKLN